MKERGNDLQKINNVIFISGLRYYADSSLRTSFSDEISSGASLYAKDGPDGVITLEETRTVEEKIEYEETFPKEPPKEVPPEENQTLQLEFLEKLDIKVRFSCDPLYFLCGFECTFEHPYFAVLMFLGSVISYGHDCTSIHLYELESWI